MQHADHVSYFNSTPFVPEGSEVVFHEEKSSFNWSSSKVALFISPNQRRGNIVTVEEFCKELQGKQVLNANVLDFLLAHKHLIPEQWKESADGGILYIFFWGTIYRLTIENVRYVRFLCWACDSWGWSSRRFDWLWDRHYAAAYVKKSLKH